MACNIHGNTQKCTSLSSGQSNYRKRNAESLLDVHYMPDRRVFPDVIRHAMDPEIGKSLAANTESCQQVKRLARIDAHP